MTDGATPVFFKSLRINRAAALCITATLHQEIPHLTLAVDGTPKVVLLASDHDDHFIKEPVIGWLVTVLPKAPSLDTTEMQESSTYRVVGDIQSAFRQKFLDIAKAEGKASIHPDRQLNDLRWKSINEIESIFYALVLVIRLSSGQRDKAGRRTKRPLTSSIFRI